MIWYGMLGMYGRYGRYGRCALYGGMVGWWDEAGQGVRGYCISILRRKCTSNNVKDILL